MDIKLILIFLYIIGQISWIQNCDFEIRDLTNIPNGESVRIDKSKYNPISFTMGKKYSMNVAYIQQT
ncbi:hypothetical protein [Flavivirga spongiicola]|uniref:Uncharacterized protein n=1 Tax=Flavivirga spongiicola TaxID=421621 RepID=A0ABU7XPP3_9FLAO|nr:hypothetical protein [Flavivirga sp. MEBiC05379]MDO5981501.1 hypothetical protein [Flavivirga sp. MEBiC05379]